LTCDRLHRGKRILDAVVQFVDEQLPLSFETAFLSDVGRDADNADNVSIGVSQRRFA
jgi:hypothetical protein